MRTAWLLGFALVGCGRSDRAVDLSEEPLPSGVEPEAPVPPSEPAAEAGAGVVVRTETVPCEVAHEVVATFGDGRRGFSRWYQARLSVGDSLISASAHYALRRTLGVSPPQADPCSVFESMGEHSCEVTVSPPATATEFSPLLVPTLDGLLVVGCGSESSHPEYMIGDIVVPASEQGERADTVTFRIAEIAN